MRQLGNILHSFFHVVVAIVVHPGLSFHQPQLLASANEEECILGFWNGLLKTNGIQSWNAVSPDDRPVDPSNALAQSMQISIPGSIVVETI